MSAKRDAAAAQAFFEKALGAPHTVTPRVINVDKNAAYPKALDMLKANQQLPPECVLRQVKYLNNRIEQHHRGLKERYYPMRGFGSFTSAARFCTAFDELRQYFRSSSSRQHLLSLSEQRKYFRQRFDCLITLSARF